jgi:hypothetical protein
LAFDSRARLSRGELRINRGNGAQAGDGDS